MVQRLVGHTEPGQTTNTGSPSLTPASFNRARASARAASLYVIRGCAHTPLALCQTRASGTRCAQPRGAVDHEQQYCGRETSLRSGEIRSAGEFRPEQEGERYAKTCAGPQPE